MKRSAIFVACGFVGVSIILHSCTKVEPETSGTFIDSRDGNEYEWVKIGDQIWMAENLAYLPSVSPPTEVSETAPYYYVYGYQGYSVNEARASENYSTYGVLYNWPASMLSCPIGWHLPTDEEWKLLEGAVDSQYGIGDQEWDGVEWRGSDAGIKLKDTAGWLENGNGTNLFKFSGLPGGHRKTYWTGYFDQAGSTGYWWTSTNEIDGAWYRQLGHNDVKVGRDRRYNPYIKNNSAKAGDSGNSPKSPEYLHDNPSNADGFSVRCVKGPIEFPVAEFVGGPSIVPLDRGASVKFLDRSINSSPRIWEWDFGDGTGSTERNVTHSYSKAGIYTVSLTVKNDRGNDTETKVNYITVIPAVETGTFTDSRDDKEYGWTKIGDQTWMSENLAYLPSVSPPSEVSETVPHYYVYNYEGDNVIDATGLDNYNSYGALYNWPAARTSCPDGWHLPSDEEWKVLEGTVDSQHRYGDTTWDGIEYRGFDAGTNLKTSDWVEEGEIADLFRFSGLPGGCHFVDWDGTGRFHDAEYRGRWWTSTESKDGVWFRLLDGAFFAGPKVHRFYLQASNGLSVRCLKNN